MGAMEIVLVVGAVLIGATGTWSPCGFSMIDTLGPGGHTGGMRTTLAACAAFAPGALIGGAITFGGLALVGSAVFGSNATAALIAASAVAALAAVAEARGARIVPQIRRQLPEHWRRVMPMPLAAALYGVLLGLGFTTFVLTFGVWALAAISFAGGDPALGLWIGVAFGIGRALPVVLIAPFSQRPLGWRACETMAEGSLYRRIRLGDATVLLAAAIALGVSAGEAHAASTALPAAADPSATGKSVVFQKRAGRAGVLVEGGHAVGLPGTDPAISSSRIAVLRKRQKVEILRRSDRSSLGGFSAPRVDAVALDDHTIAYRTRKGGRDRLFVRRLESSGDVGKASMIATVKPPGQIGRPSVDQGRIAYARSSPRSSTIIVRRGGRSRAALRSRFHVYSNPTILGSRMAYIDSAKNGDHLRVRKVEGDSKGHGVYSGEGLWSTALSKKFVYVTLVKGSAPSQRILRLKP
jgi:hypothetical protein